MYLECVVAQTRIRAGFKRHFSLSQAKVDGQDDLQIRSTYYKSFNSGSIKNRLRSETLSIDR